MREYHNRKDVLALHGNRCKICGGIEKEVGKLVLAHYKAVSRRGKEVFPLCPNCHSKYDNGMLTISDLKKIGLTQEEYKKYQPKKGRQYKCKLQLPTLYCQKKRADKSCLKVPNMLGGIRRCPNLA